MNDIITEISRFNIRRIKEAFVISKNVFSHKESGTLFHSGEYGSYRETLIKDWLRLYIPERFGISSGFIITGTNKVSTQCDIIIYDKRVTPTIDNNGQRFFPIETVVSVGEIKSDIQSASELNKYLYKLAKTKELRLEIASDSEVYERPFETSMKRDISLNPDKISPSVNIQPNNYLEISFEGNPYDNIYTFLICNKFNFDLTKLLFKYKDIQPFSQHNAILSLNDGLFNYITPNGTPNMSYPVSGKIVLEHYFTKESDDDHTLAPYIRGFLKSLHNNVNETTIFKFDIQKYLFPDSDIIYGIK